MPNIPSESLEKFFFHVLHKPWLRTPDPATAFPTLILIESEPPLVALLVPNAPSESLEKCVSFIFFHFLCKFWLPFLVQILAPNTERLQRPVLENQGFGAPEPRPYSLHNSAHSLAQSPEPTV